MLKNFPLEIDPYITHPIYVFPKNMFYFDAFLGDVKS